MNLYSRHLITPASAQAVEHSEFHQLGMRASAVQGLGVIGAHQFRQLRQYTKEDILAAPNLGRACSELVFAAADRLGVVWAHQSRFVQAELDLPPFFDSADRWLQSAAELIRPWFEEIGHPFGEVRVSADYGLLKPELRSSQKYRGVCWAKRVTSGQGNFNQLCVTPQTIGTMDALVVLTHELIHAADDCKSGHRKNFQLIATALEHPDGRHGAAGAFYDRLRGYLSRLGRYPRYAAPI